MAGEDALAAAKAAALQDLTQQTTSTASRRARRRPRRRARSQKALTPANGNPPESTNNDGLQSNENVEYVPETIDAIVSVARTEGSSPADGVFVSSEALEEIASVFKRFEEKGHGETALEPSTEEQNGDVDLREEPNNTHAVQKSREGAEGGEDVDDEVDTADDAIGGDAAKDASVSRKQRKELQRNLISRLKSFSDFPDVVESWDVTAPDPFLLVHLKAWPNSVTVPVNWRQKRKYLQNKRGMEKRAFKLPAYIMDTGVGELRDAQIEADEKKSLKQRQREKMRAKTGRGVEIDHGRLHDAFFKFQVKPRLTGHGDVYYELRELEVDHSKFRPGVLSESLRAALDMADGDPPPWLVNMQRYGPPPGYPGLKIPGLNAPIPAGARFGYQPGGWGKPPVDTNGRPLYGDVFAEGIEFAQQDRRFDLNEHEKANLWGSFASVSEGLAVPLRSDEDDEEEDSEHEVEPTIKSTSIQASTEGKGGFSPIQTAQSIVPDDVRKGVPSGQLYTVLEQRRVSVQENAMMGSSHVYDVKENTSTRGPEDQRDGSQKKRKEPENKEAPRVAKKQKQFKF